MFSLLYVHKFMKNKCEKVQLKTNKTIFRRLGNKFLQLKLDPLKNLLSGTSNNILSMERGKFV